jgi:hypothetical protein
MGHPFHRYFEPFDPQRIKCNIQAGDTKPFNGLTPVLLVECRAAQLIRHLTRRILEQSVSALEELILNCKSTFKRSAFSTHYETVSIFAGRSTLTLGNG